MNLIKKLKSKLHSVRNSKRKVQSRVLIYCGIHNGDGFDACLSGYDLIYGFDANPDKIKAAKERYRDNTKVSIIHGVLGEVHNQEIEFNITENWDASSSVGKLNPEFPHMKDDKSPLFKTPVRTIKVPAINLYRFCIENGIDHIDLLVSDLQGMDLTILKTLKPFLDSGDIKTIHCEVEKDDKPNIYIGTPSNKLSDFKKLLTNYKITESSTEPDWWEMDVTWELKI